MIARAALVASLAFAVAASADEKKRYEGSLVSFSYPAAGAVTPGADPNADVALTVTLPNGIVATVLASAKKVAPNLLNATADAWHDARLKNRAAWGMKPHGGPPPEDIGRDGNKRWRWRDRIGSVLGAQEQTMTCGPVAGHMGCVVVSAPQKERERADAIASQILSSMSIRKK